MGNLSKDFLRSKGIKDFLVVSTGRTVASGLGFLASIILARELGPEDFGLFSLSLAIMIVISGITGGSIDQATVKFSSAYLNRDKEKAESIFNTTFKIKIIIGLVLLLAGFLLSKPLSRIVFNESGSEHLISLAFVGATGIIFLGFVLAFLQSHQAFGKHILLEVLNNFMKLSVIGVLLLVHVLDPISSMAIYVVSPFLAFLVGLTIIPKTFLRARSSHGSLLPEIIHFSKWIVLSYVIFALYRRMDIFLLNYFEEFQTVGIYSAAFMIASTLDLVAVSLFVVVFPKVSRFTARKEYVNFITRFLTGAIPLYILTCIVFWWISKPLIITFYTTEFADSVSILRILVPGYAVYIVALPLSAIILSRNKPQIIVAVDFTTLLVMFFASISLIPLYKAEGAAVAALISNLMFMMLIISWTIKEVRKIPTEESAGIMAGNPPVKSSNSYL